MHRINIKSKDRRFKIKPNWEFHSGTWSYYSIPSVDGLKLITDPNIPYYIVFIGDLEPFELDKDTDWKHYRYSTDTKFAPSVMVSHKDENGFYHIKTEAGTFKIKFIPMDNKSGNL